MKYDPGDTSFLMNVTSVMDIYFILCVCVCVCMYVHTHNTCLFFKDFALFKATCTICTERKK